MEARAAHDVVAIATAGAAGAAAVAGTAMVEVTTVVPVVPAVIQVGSKGAVEATTAPVAVGVAAVEVVVIRPPAAVGTAGGGATGERSAPRRRAISCPGALGTKVFGHEESACSSDATILVMELPDNDSEEEKVFAAKAAGKCSLRIGEEVGDRELDKQVAQYIDDGGATCHMTPFVDGSYQLPRV